MSLDFKSYPYRRQEPEVYLAITDCEVIVTEVTSIISPWVVRGGRRIMMLNIETPLPMEVLAWINVLRRDDGGVGAR